VRLGGRGGRAWEKLLPKERCVIVLGRWEIGLLKGGRRGRGIKVLAQLKMGEGGRETCEGAIEVHPKGEVCEVFRVLANILVEGGAKRKMGDSGRELR
jgi:hypothetical protein